MKSAQLLLPLAAVSLAPRVAWPCSPPPPGLRAVLPTNEDSVRLPINGVLFINFSGQEPEAFLLRPGPAEENRLPQSAFGRDSWSQWQIAFLPTGVLIRDRVESVDAMITQIGPAGGPVTRRSLEIALEPDGRAPTPVNGVDYALEERPTRPCDDAGHYLRASFRQGSMDDFGPVAGYALVERTDEGLSVTRFMEPSLVDGPVNFDLFLGEARPTGRCFAVVAVDFAANLSDPSPNEHCIDQAPPDAGVEDAFIPEVGLADVGPDGSVQPDAAVRSDGGVASSDVGARGRLEQVEPGCSCTTTPARASGFMGAGLVLVAHVRRRQRG